MENPETYIQKSAVQKRNIQHIIDQHTNVLKDISGKCMDVGCGPGNSTFELLLPTLHPNATLIGKRLNKLYILL